MAVDIKTLRIGSHVQHHGKRKIVLSIGGDTVYLLPSIVSSVAHIAKTDEIEPIPITAGLLKELGFKWRKDSSCWRKYQNYDGERYDWGIYAFYNHISKEWCFDLFLPDFKRPRLYAKHLHELEGQLAYYSIELIKE